MKKFRFIPLFALLFLLAGCPGNNYVAPLKRLQDNNMDLPDNRQYHYRGISYELSDLFYHTSYDEFLLTTTGDVKSINELNIYFSIENFDEEDAINFQESFDSEISYLDAVHDNYVIERQESLFDPEVTIKKELPESVKYPGALQVINGAEYDGEPPSSYFMATLEVDGTYYVFHLIGKKENMGYLYDDFIDILSSVHQ